MEHTPDKIQYFLYARKSTDSEDRQVASIDDQISELKKIAEREGLEVVDILTEKHSAKTPGARPVFNSMLQRITKGEAQGILCWKKDRLARNPIDAAQIDWMLQQNVIQHVRTFERSDYPSDNIVMRNIEFSMANQYIRELSVNIKRGKRNKAERGIYPGPAPVGYMNDKHDVKGNKHILKDPERFESVKKLLYAIHSRRYTPMQLFKVANEEWRFTMPDGRKLARSTLYRIITNPFYCGQYEFPRESGNWYKGSHEPMISEEEYDEIQVILGRKGKQRPKKYVFAFTGIIRCAECGAMVTAEERVKRQMNGNTHRYIYYHCTKRINPSCTQKCLEEKQLRKQIAFMLDRVEIPQLFHEWAIKWYRKDNAREMTDKKSVLDKLQNEYKKCVEKIDSLIDMRAAQEITQEEFGRRKSALTKEKIKLEGALAKTGDQIQQWLNKAEEIFNFAETARKEFEDGGLEKRKRILTNLGSNPELKDRILRISIQKPLLIIEKAAPEVRAIHARFEPLENPYNKREIERAYAQSSVIRRGRDSNSRCLAAYPLSKRTH